MQTRISNVKGGQRSYWPGLDILKLVLAIFIVAAHCRLFEENLVVKEWFDRLSSIAVPLFFGISSFLFTKKLEACPEIDKKQLLRKTISRLLVLFSVWYIIVFPVTYFRWWSVATFKESLFALFL